VSSVQIPQTTELSPGISKEKSGEGDGLAEPTSTPAIEIGGRNGPDPTRFGDWEKNGRCIDF
jgi:hypothetical protein